MNRLKSLGIITALGIALCLIVIGILGALGRL